MKSTLFLAFVCGSAVAQNLDSADQSSKNSRNFCCTLYDAKAECHDRCQGQPCDSMCESRCGIANSLCGRWPCQEVTLADAPQQPHQLHQLLQHVPRLGLRVVLLQVVQHQLNVVLGCHAFLLLEQQP